MKKTLIFSGGGSGGHVLPALTLIEILKRRTPTLEIEYVGSFTGIESRLTKQSQLPYTAISTGKLRRYFSWQNFVDIFRLMAGVFQSFFYLLSKKGSSDKILIFTTGGFVTVPLALAAWLLRVPLYVHEQTSRAGLANRIVGRFANKVFVSFEASKSYFPEDRTFFSGYPLREKCFGPASSSIVVENTQLPDDGKILFVTGGGNGSAMLNQLVKNYLEGLTQRFFIVHQVGQDHINDYAELASHRYLPVAFVGEEMIDLLKRADVVISRAGAGTVSELMAMGKRSILVPLKIAQKNEQYHNAMEAVRKLNSLIIEEDELDQINLLKLIEDFMSEPGQTMTPDGSPVKATDLLVGEILKKLEIEA